MWQKWGSPDQEKQLVVGLPQFAEEADDATYLIYRPTRQLPAGLATQ